MSRVAAMVQAAVFDAVNGVDRRYSAIMVDPAAPSGASRRAAAVQAAYVILSKLYGASPANAFQLTFDARRVVSMAVIVEKDSNASINGTGTANTTKTTGIEGSATTFWKTRVSSEHWTSRLRMPRSAAGMRSTSITTGGRLRPSVKRPAMVIP